MWCVVLFNGYNADLFNFARGQSVYFVFFFFYVKLPTRVCECERWRGGGLQSQHEFSLVISEVIV